MDRMKFSSIAHRHHVFHSPLNDLKVDRVVELLGLPGQARVLDADCGPGEFLIRVVERYGARGVGVDLSPYAIAQASARAAQRVPGADVVFHEVAIDDFEVTADAWDVVICVGSTHLYGNYRGALDALQRIVKPGGLLLIGDLYWQHDPDPALVATLGMPAGHLMTHAGNVTAGVEAGWTPLYSCVSSDDDWDHYEGLYARSVELYAIDNPDDPDLPLMLERSRTWRDTFLRYGRGTLGFGLYLFLRPPESTPT